MKKKLIAIVASLAMVATMVPSAAFAASTEWTGSQDVTSKTVARLSLAGYGNIKADGTTDAEATSSLAMKTYGTNSTIEGWLPYIGADFAKGDANKGHYADIVYSVPKIDATGATKWGILRPSVEREELVDGNGKISEPYTIWRLSKNSYLKDAGGEIPSTIRLDDYNGLFESQVLFVDDTNWSPDPESVEGEDGIDANTPNTYTANYYPFVDKANIPNVAAKANYFKLSTLDKIITSEGEHVKGIANLSVDYSKVILLSEEDTNDLKNFVKNAKVLEDATVDKYYSDLVDTATKAYNRLGTDAVAALNYSVDKELDDAVANAYETLQAGIKNAESYENLNDVAALIKAIPVWKAEYVNDDAIVAQVEAAQRAEGKLTEGVADILLDATKGYLSENDIANYKAAKKGIENKLVSAVIAKIDALQAITGDFTNQETVDAIAAPWKEACEAYEDLGTLKSSVTNASKLTNYTKTYKTAMEKYANSIWEAVSELDVTEGLKAEDRAKVAELKSYIDNEYVNTTQMKVEIAIKDFDKKIYNKLVEALKGANATVYDLTNAKIDAIADQSYTGKAIKPEVTVKDGEGTDIAAENYYVSYDNNLEVGTATVTIVAKSDSDYYGEATATFTITPAALTDAMVKSVANATYTGKAVTPAVTVENGVTYTVAYSNNTAVGKATATITGTGNYTGTITKNFIVKPATEAISSLKAGKKSLTVAYKAQTGAKYRIVYSPAKGQAKAVNTTATKKTIKSLKAGKTYKVKVRAYKVVDGKTYNGTYSTVKKVKVK